MLLTAIMKFTLPISLIPLILISTTGYQHISLDIFPLHLTVLLTYTMLVYIYQHYAVYEIHLMMSAVKIIIKYLTWIS